MLPYMAQVSPYLAYLQTALMSQGASQAIEDAAALAKCLQHLSLDEVGKAYERIRYSRATQIQAYARAQRAKNHMPDGPEQEERDANMKAPDAAMRSAYSWKWESVDGQPAKPWNEGLFGYDAEEAALQYIQRIQVSSL